MPSAVEQLQQAKQCVEQMRQAAEAGAWDELPSLDKATRERFDAALNLYATADEAEQRAFRELGGQLLTQHRETLDLAEQQLGSLREEVAGALRSGKVARSYTSHSE